MIVRLADLFPDSAHVSTVGLLQAPDKAVWELALADGYAILTADADFHELATAMGPPPKVIWLRNCDFPTASIEHLIRSQAVRIMEFLEDADRAILVLPPPRFLRAAY